MRLSPCRLIPQAVFPCDDLPSPHPIFGPLNKPERICAGVAGQLLERGKHGGDEFLVVLLDNVLAERRHQLAQHLRVGGGEGGGRGEERDCMGRRQGR